CGPRRAGGSGSRSPREGGGRAAPSASSPSSAPAAQAPTSQLAPRRLVAGEIRGRAQPDRPDVTRLQRLDQGALAGELVAEERGGTADLVDGARTARPHAGKLEVRGGDDGLLVGRLREPAREGFHRRQALEGEDRVAHGAVELPVVGARGDGGASRIPDAGEDRADRKSTRLNSSHVKISY